LSKKKTRIEKKKSQNRVAEGDDRVKQQKVTPDMQGGRRGGSMVWGGKGKTTVIQEDQKRGEDKSSKNRKRPGGKEGGDGEGGKYLHALEPGGKKKRM